MRLTLVAFTASPKLSVTLFGCHGSPFSRVKMWPVSCHWTPLEALGGLLGRATADDLVMGIQGIMRLVKEPMALSDAMAIWEMQVTKVKQDTSPAQRVIQGPASLPRSDKAQAFEQAAFAELKGGI